MTVIVFFTNGEVVATAEWDQVFIGKDGFEGHVAGQTSLFNYDLNRLKKVIVDGVTVFECGMQILHQFGCR